VELYQELSPAMICPMILVFYDEEIELEIGETRIAEVIVNDAPPAVLAEVQIVDEPEPTRVDHVIEDVELLVADGETALRVSGYQPDGCEFPVEVEVSYEKDWVIVEIYRDIPANVRCPDVIVPFDEIIPLEDFDEHMGDLSDQMRTGWAIEVNDFLGMVLPLILQPGETLPPGSVIVGEREIVPVDRDYSSVELIAVSIDGREVTLDVEGYHTTGCRWPVRMRHEVVGNDLLVEIYRPSSPAELEVCPAILLGFSKTLTLELLPGDYTYDVNGVTGEFSVARMRDRGEDVEATMRSHHVIDSVEVLILESFPPQLQLLVSGYIPDGCQAKTHVDIEQVDNTFTVKIYRELPLGVMCPMVIVEYSDSISLGPVQPGSYTIDVNGVIVEVDAQ
jgi:hypothetical protein